ncbi:MAG TPA: NAD(P)/FAD-dependent oxidoreductase [Longimicrobiaceae bacterium]|nr:NAD(P)/FAD-dependent oxidoreductase [Longimicrobiaceae bacterium]
MEYDVVVVGSGPNGLAAAVKMAQAGRSVLVLEAEETIGGAARTVELTLPGFHHDAFSSVYPLGIGSPFFRSLPLEEHGLEWVHPPAPLAHPFDDRTAAVLERSVTATAEGLGEDGEAWHALVWPLVAHWHEMAPDLLSPLGIVRHPLRMAAFGLNGLRSLKSLVEARFRGDHARALLGGCSAHVGLPLTYAATASYGLVLVAAGHAVGWPFARGGAGAITQALASLLRSLGGEIQTGVRVRSLGDLPPHRAALLDVTAKQLLAIAGDRLPARYRHALERFRLGCGVFKVDWALSGTVPWKAPEVQRAGTVHLGGTPAEIYASEREPIHGRVAERPFVLFAQPSAFDDTRTPAGQHTAWGYCHVPNGSTVDMTEAIEAQVERFAPGFRDLILARWSASPARLEAADANLVGGDVNGGAGMLSQLFFRPAPRVHPYRTPIPGVYLCFASTPPGGGVHGMCGYHAARAALADGY